MVPISKWDEAFNLHHVTLLNLRADELGDKLDVMSTLLSVDSYQIRNAEFTTAAIRNGCESLVALSVLRSPHNETVGDSTV